MRYRIESGRLNVTARSRVHDTTTVWNRIAGEVEADADTLATTGATAKFTVDMTAFDAGDWLKNRKLRKDFEMDAHPRATFELTKLTNVVRSGATFTATAEGLLEWRGKRVPLVLTGAGRLDSGVVEAKATFDLDIKVLGIAAPRFLMFKVEDDVAVEVSVHGVGLGG